MAQKLQTIVTLSGEVDNSFGRLGSELTNLGNQVDEVSRQLINFGRESVKEYASYDDTMREVQALGEYTASQRATMDEYNKMIAQSSRFTMQQTAEAEVMIGQLGLNWNQTKTLMPTVMNLAVAGNIELADSLNYLYYSLQSLGTPLEYAGTLSDQMAKTAAISASDIDTLGLSLQRLGSGAQYFTGGSSEILAILGGISQFGEDMQGAEAGTQLRNFMLTLMAPTASKQKLMDQLKISETEWAAFESYIADAQIDLTETATAMESLGLSAFDVNGNLKPAIQIIGELKGALENIGSEADQKGILGQLFGKRTTITAENLLESYDSIVAYQEQLLNESEGYTETLANTMDGGVGGTLRNTEAAIASLHNTVGGILAPEVEFWAGLTTDAVNGLNNMDPAALEALVSGGTALALVGPGLLTAGSAFRLIGRLMTPLGWKLLAVTTLFTGLASAVRYFNEVYEAEFADKFGELDLMGTALPQYIADISASFDAGYQQVSSWSIALDNAVAAYEAASEAFAGGLLADMIAGQQLSESDKQQYYSLGEDMDAALREGAKSSLNESVSFWEYLFGGDTEQNYLFDDISALLTSEYQSLIDEANTLGEQLRNSMFTAFKDNVVTAEEYADIKSVMQAYNDAMTRAAAEAQEESDYIEFQKLLNKGQTASYDSVDSMRSEITAQRDERLSQLEDNFLTEYFKLQYRYEEAIASGQKINGEVATAEGMQFVLDELSYAHGQKMAEVQAMYDEPLLRMWENVIGESQLQSTYGNLEALADLVLSAGVDRVDATELFGKEDRKDRKNIKKYVNEMLASFGGAEAMASQALYYRQNGYDEGAERMDRLLMMADIVNNKDSGYVRTDDVNYSVDTAHQIINALSGGSGEMDSFWQMVGESLTAGAGNRSLLESIWDAPDAVGEIQKDLSEIYNFDRVLEDLGSTFAAESAARDTYAAYSLLYGPASSNAEKYLINPPQEAVSTTMEIPNGAEAAAAANADAQTYLSANPLSQTLTISTRYSGIPNTGAGNGRGKFATQRLTFFADGGRATSASIFGEAGAEWAIPEEHTQRVAELLNAAREGAGFTWPELLSRTGGLNAGNAHMPMHLVYAPVIHAQDASGVEQKLLEDKQRLQRWLEEKQLMDDVEVYA